MATKIMSYVKKKNSSYIIKTKYDKTDNSRKIAATCFCLFVFECEGLTKVIQERRQNKCPVKTERERGGGIKCVWNREVDQEGDRRISSGAG